MKTKNNRRYLQSILGAIVAVSAALVLSCEQPDVSSLTAPAGKGSVILTVSTGSPPGSAVKTILPDEQPGFSRYELVFTPKEGTVGEPVEVEVIPDELAGGLYQQELEAGTWTVKVTAYRLIASTGNGEEPGTEDAVEYKAAEGESDPFTVSAGGESPQVWVTIRPIPIADSAGLTGFFVYSVSLPSDASGTLTLTSSGGFNKTITLDVENNVVEEQQPGTGAGGSTYAYIEDSEELAAGYYDLSVELTRGGSSILAWEVVHIYAGLESWAYFGAGPEDFTRTLYLSGPIPELEGLEVGSGSGIEVYTDPNYSGKPLPVETHTSENVDAWIVGVPAADALGKTLYIKSTVVDTSGIALHYEGDTGEKTLTEAGRRDIILYPTLVGIPGGTEGTPAELPAAALNTAIAVATEAGQPVTLNNVTIVGTPPGPDEFDAVYLDGAVVTVTGKLVIPANVAVAVGGPLQPDQPVPPDQPGPLLSLSDGTGGSTGKAGDSATLNVPANATVEVSGGLLVAGTLNVAQGGDVTVKSGGGFFLDGSGIGPEGGLANNGTLDGTITIASGAEAYSTGTFAGNGWTVIEAGGAAYANPSLDDDNPVPTIGGGDAVLNLTSGTFAFNTSGYILDGDATVTQNFGITDGISLLVKAKKTLTIDIDDEIGGKDPYPAFWVIGDGTSITGEAGAVIAVTKQEGENKLGKIIFSMNPPSPNANFYDVSGDKLPVVNSNPSNLQTTVGYGTYHWNTELNGWKEDITYSAKADGSEAKTSTKITFKFNETVTLAESDIAITGVSLVPDSLDGEEDEWTVGITGIEQAGTATVSINKTGIDSAGHQVTLYKDITPPAEVTSLKAEAGDTEVTLTWTDPADEDFASVVITYIGGNTGGTVNVNAGEKTSTVYGLTNKTAYTFTVKTVDREGNVSTGETTTATPLAPTGSFTVNFTGLPEDETISTNDGGEPISLSLVDNDELSVSVTGGGETDTYRWTLDGKAIAGTGSSLTRKARTFSAGGHTLTVFVTKGGVEYAKIVTFTVAE